MAGTPNRNTRGPQSGGTRRPQSSGTRRPQSGARRPQSSGTRRPANNRRRTARRRYTPFFMRPGFWLLVCIVVIIGILIFKGCDGGKDKDKDSTDPTTVVYSGTPEPTEKTESTNATKPTTAPPSADDPVDTPTERPTQTPTEEPTEAPTEKPTEEPTDPPVGNQIYGTHRVTPGFYLLGEDLAAGSVTIEVASGSGSIKTSDGRLSVSQADINTPKITGIVFNAGEYLSVTGDIKLTVVYVSEKVNVSLSRPTVKEDGLNVELGEAGADYEYYVMSEGGDLVPGIYMLEIKESFGVINIPDRVSGVNVDLTVGIYDGYNKTIDYVVLKEGDIVTIKGCMVEFFEMEGE